MIVARKSQRSSRGADTGVNDGAVQRAWWKLARGVAQDKSSCPYVLGADFVTQVYNSRFGSNLENDAFHGTDIIIAPAKISRQRYDGPVQT